MTMLYVFELHFLFFLGVYGIQQYYHVEECPLENNKRKNDAMQMCQQFFHGKIWPLPKNSTNRGIVRLCQTQTLNNEIKKEVFATLFSTTDHIPLYSANKVVLHINASDYPRPKPKYWERVATSLCNIKSLPTHPIRSNLSFVSRAKRKTCRQYQAVSEDYADNGMHLDRGHLSPNSINSQDCEKQLGTFTLTNVAPQFASFNRESWREYECITQQTILDFVPGEEVYIITGTYGTALDKNGKPLWMNKVQFSSSLKLPVKVPAYFWKAVCYPGNLHESRKAWGYAIVKKNVNRKETADYKSYVTLKQFSKQYFQDLPFGLDCLNAPFGKFSSIFSNWTRYLRKHCK